MRHSTLPMQLASVLVLPSLTAVFLTSCGGASFSSDNPVVESNSQRDPGTNGADALLGNTALNQPGQSDVELVQQGGNQQSGPSTLNVQRMCSDRLTTQIGTNVRRSAGLVAVLMDTSGRSYTIGRQEAAKIKSDIENLGRFSIDASEAPDGSYQLRLCDVAMLQDCANRPPQERMSGTFGRLAGNYARGVVGDSDNVTVNQGKVVNRLPMTVVFFSNPEHGIVAGQMANMFQGMFGQMSSAAPELNSFASLFTTVMPQGYTPTEQDFIDARECDLNSSPLVIDLNNLGVDLSAPTDGVQFDITGDGNQEQISWPVNRGNAFLVLDRNENGTIDDVHELFGDNTVGPDGKTAANGFLALAKYDDYNDGVIDDQDEVFDQLRLWQDYNRDGKTDPGELSTLSDHGIVAIHLNYRDGYEEDKYGNSTRERSVVELEDGSMRMIFDIWFRPLFD